MDSSTSGFLNIKYFAKCGQDSCFCADVLNWLFDVFLFLFSNTGRSKHVINSWVPSNIQFGIVWGMYFVILDASTTLTTSWLGVLLDISNYNSKALPKGFWNSECWHTLKNNYQSIKNEGHLDQSLAAYEAGSCK